jgi:hypothetical protein
LHLLEARDVTNNVVVGTFLFSRISSEDGRDSRFDEIRTSPPKFLGAFFAQASSLSLMSSAYSSTSAVSASKPQQTSKRANGWKKRRIRSTMKIS